MTVHDSVNTGPSVNISTGLLATTIDVLRSFRSYYCTDNDLWRDNRWRQNAEIERIDGLIARLEGIGR